MQCIFVIFLPHTSSCQIPLIPLPISGFSLPWSVVDIPSDTPLENNWFSLLKKAPTGDRYLTRGAILCTCPNLWDGIVVCFELVQVLSKLILLFRQVNLKLVTLIHSHLKCWNSKLITPCLSQKSSLSYRLSTSFGAKFTISLCIFPITYTIRIL